MRPMRVAEVISTIQGETTRAGEPCVLVRLAGCNLACRWCDTRWARAGGSEASVAEILSAVEAAGPGARLACVTGGEPMVQPETPGLLAALLASGRAVQLMTNGSIPLDTVPAGVSKVVDAKTPWSQAPDAADPGGPTLLANLAALGPGDEVKVVVADRRDFEWALALAADARLPGRVRSVAVAPAWGLLDPATLAAWILASRLPIRLNLQLHKVVWGGETRK